MKAKLRATHRGCIYERIFVRLWDLEIICYSIDRGMGKTLRIGRFTKFFFNPHPKIYLLILERKGERDINVSEKPMGFLPYAPQLGSDLQPFGVWDGAPNS